MLVITFIMTVNGFNVASQIDQSYLGSYSCFQGTLLYFDQPVKGVTCMNELHRVTAPFGYVEVVAADFEVQ
jgi:hypothetical protein